MDMIGRIRRLHSRGKKSELEIARMTGLSRNTVAKWLHGQIDGPPKYRRGPQPNKLTPFVETIAERLIQTLFDAQLQVGWAVRTLRELAAQPAEALVESRYEKFRRMGKFLEPEAV